MTIKILHFSDTHFGTENYGRIDPVTGLNTRLLDFGASLDEAIRAALAEGVDLAVFSGDAYRSRDPSSTHQREFARRIHGLAAAGVPIFLLVGNHDLPAQTGKANSVDIFETLGVANVTIGRRPGVHTIATRKGPVQIAGLPWVPRAALLARDEFKNRTLDEINDEIGRRIAQYVGSLAEGLDPELPAVLCAHLSLTGATYSSERSIMIGQDVVVPKSAVAHEAFDYVALGHIHKHQALNTFPPVVYAGSLDRVDFGEERDDKGYVLVDLAKGRCDYSFRPVAARKFVTIEVRAEGDDPLGQVLATIDRHDLSEAIVRVLIHTTPEKEAQIPYAEVRKALGDAHYVAAVAKQVQREDRHRLGGRLAEAMTPDEALRLYLRTKEVPEARQKVLLEYAEALARGEE